MEHRESNFQGYAQLELYYQSWHPEGDTAAALAIVHGAGDHSGRFGRLVQPLVEHGYTVYAYDLRGFGRSPGKRGHINHWKEYREDTLAFLQLIRQQEPGLPVFLFGYSLGAAIVLELVLYDPDD